jgi:hypothetical protein
MKNKLTDLNNHLFAQLERLGEEGLTEEEIKKEVRRAESIVHIAEVIIANAAVQLKAVQLAADHGDIINVPFMQIEYKKL